MAIGIVIAKTRSVELVRLLGAVLVGLLACWFVATYHELAETRMAYDHPGIFSPSDDWHFVTAYQYHAYIVPIVGLGLGCLVIWGLPEWKVLNELIVQILWISALAWVGNVLIVWQLQNIPIFSGMQWHY